MFYKENEMINLISKLNQQNPEITPVKTQYVNEYGDVMLPNDPRIAKYEANRLKLKYKKGGIFVSLQKRMLEAAFIMWYISFFIIFAVYLRIMSFL